MSENPWRLSSGPDLGVLDVVSVTSAIHVAEYAPKCSVVGATNRAGERTRAGRVRHRRRAAHSRRRRETSSSASNVRRRTSPGMPSLRSMALSETYSISRSGARGRPPEAGPNRNPPVERTREG